MEVSSRGFPIKDLREDPHSNEDNQRKGNKYKAVHYGHYALKKGAWAGPEVAVHQD